MTNEQIILTAKKELVAAGAIGTDEELHTYKHWRKLGYQVFKGEKAVCALNIWQYFRKNDEEDDEEGDKKKVPEGKMRMKRAYFFSSQQVFAIEG